MLSNTTTAATKPSLWSATSFANAATKMTTKCRHREQRYQIKEHNGILLSSSTATATLSSFYGLNKLLLTVALFGLLMVSANAKDESSKLSPASTASSSLSPRDEIYIDDEGIDGSGHGGIHDDLEKDHDFSGSGFGPDDEDSDSDYRHNTHKHQTGKSNINKNIDDNAFITTIRNNQNFNNNHQTSSNSGIINSNNNNQGNSGFTSSGGSSATGGLNTIETNNHEKQFNSSISFPSITQQTDIGNTTTTISLHNNNNDTNHTIQQPPPPHTPIIQQQNKNTSHMFPYFPDKNNNNDNNQQNHGKSVPPPPLHHDNSDDDDDDDFDIEEEETGILGAGSGDGGLIGRGNDNDDDDHTGDIDEDTGDELPDITKYQHGIYNSATPSKPVDEHSKTQVDNDDFETEEDFDHNQPIDHDDEDDNDDDDDAGVVHKTHSKDGGELYTDITDETGTGSSSSSSPSSSTTEKRPGGINTQGGTNIHDLDTNSINSLPPDTKIIEQTTGNEVSIMNANDDDRTASFFAQPGILAAVIGGAVVGLLCAILVVMFIVYRMRKKDEGSYALDEPKRSPAMNSYAKNATNREFYA